MSSYFVLASIHYCLGLSLLLRPVFKYDLKEKPIRLLLLEERF